MRHVCLLVLSFALLVPASCAQNRNSAQPTPANGFVKAPPKPGSSISHTRMCECLACSPRDCCDGTDESQVDDPSCTTDYDFTKNESCGISVKSCTTRCSREIWRVRLTEDCELKRPATCCG